MSNAQREMEFVRDVAKSVITTPFGLYADAWGFNDNSSNNKNVDGRGDSTNPFLAPLTKPMGVIFNNMQEELDHALKIEIY